jgi:hypothetical protein
MQLGVRPVTDVRLNGRDRIELAVRAPGCVVRAHAVAVGAPDSAPAARDDRCLSLKSHVFLLRSVWIDFLRRMSRTVTWPLVPQSTGRGHVSQKSVIAAGVHAGDDRVEPFSHLIWGDDVDEPFALDAGPRHQHVEVQLAYQRETVEVGGAIA